MYTWSSGDVISSARLNALEGDRAPVTIESITGQPNGVLTAYPVSTLLMATANIGDYVYLFGGINTSGTQQTTVYRYSISGNSYTAMASLATARPYRAVVVGSDIYLIHAGSPAETLRYNVSSNTYTTLTAYGTAGCVQMSAIGTNIFFMTSNNTVLVKYDTVAATYSTMAAIPVAAFYRFATNGTDLYLFGAANSYLYSVSANTYTSKSILPALWGATSASTTIDSLIHGPLYVGNSGTTRNKNKFFVQVSNTTATSSGIVIYDITANSWVLGTSIPSSGNRGSFCATSTDEMVLNFNYNTNSVTPWNTNSVNRYITYLSPYTATSQGIAVVYPSGQTIRNETTAVNGQIIAFKAGDVITNNASRGESWGGSSVSAFDAIVIKKG